MAAASFCTRLSHRDWRHLGHAPALPVVQAGGWPLGSRYRAVGSVKDWRNLGHAPALKDWRNLGHAPVAQADRARDS